MTTKADLKSNVYWRNRKDLPIMSGDVTPVSEDMVTLVGLVPQRTAGGEMQARNVDNTAYADFRADTITAETGFVGDITGSVTTDMEVMIGTDVTGGYGLLTTSSTSLEAELSGATTDIPIQIPEGAKIIACQLRVDTLITANGGGASWSAAYNTGSTQSITTGQAFTANTKANAFYDTNVDSDITTAATDITITVDAGNFTGGIITAVVYYQFLTSITSL